MDRRKVLTSAAASTALLAGCLGATSLQNSQNQEPSTEGGVTLDRIEITNNADESTEFSTSVVVGGGKNQFHSQVSVDPGEVASPTTAWKNPAESFVVVGNHAVSNSIEVVSMNADENRTDTPLVVEFVIDEQGGLGWELNTAESN